MRRSQNPELVLFDPEIERTLRGIRKAKKEQTKAMAEDPPPPLNLPVIVGNERNNNANNGAVVQQRVLRDYCQPVVNQQYSGIMRQHVNANNFELKPALINMVQQNQFAGSPMEDPNIHLATFLEICDTIKLNGVTEDAIRLKLFPFSLRDKARAWLQSLQPGSITTWEELAQKFLTKYFPPAKTAQLRAEIVTFKQHDSETLYEAWERFKELLRRCPQHGYEEWQQVQLFYNGMNGQNRTIVDAAAGGTLMSKTPTEAKLLLEEMAANSYQWPIERKMTGRVAGMHEVEPWVAVEAKLSALTNQIASLKMQNTPSSSFEPVNAIYDSFHEREPTIEQMQYINNRNYNYRPNPLPNQYHPGLQNHENLSYGNNRNTLQPSSGMNKEPIEKKPSLEDLMSNMMSQTTSFMSETRARIKDGENRMDSMAAAIENMGASMKTMEVQIGQLASTINAQQQGNFPSDTRINPREQCKAITLRSGTILESSEPKRREASTPKLDEEEQHQKAMKEEPIKGLRSLTISLLTLLL